MAKGLSDKVTNSIEMSSIWTPCKRVDQIQTGMNMDRKFHYFIFKAELERNKPCAALLRSTKIY